MSTASPHIQKPAHVAKKPNYLSKPSPVPSKSSSIVHKPKNTSHPSTKPLYPSQKPSQKPSHQHSSTKYTPVSTSKHVASLPPSLRKKSQRPQRRTKSIQKKLDSNDILNSTINQSKQHEQVKENKEIDHKEIQNEPNEIIIKRKSTTTSIKKLDVDKDENRPLPFKLPVFNNFNSNTPNTDELIQRQSKARKRRSSLTPLDQNRNERPSISTGRRVNLDKYRASISLKKQRATESLLHSTK
ncbi:hypothetical protein QTN25_007378 [Entamoeba marina]